jgi:hypothetical protein
MSSSILVGLLKSSSSPEQNVVHQISMQKPDNLQLFLDQARGRSIVFDWLNILSISSGWDDVMSMDGVLTGPWILNYWLQRGLASLVSFLYHSMRVIVQKIQCAFLPLQTSS